MIRGLDQHRPPFSKHQSLPKELTNLFFNESSLNKFIRSDAVVGRCGSFVSHTITVGVLAMNRSANFQNTKTNMETEEEE